VSIDELFLELSEAQAHCPFEVTHVMVNVAGRWTGIAGVSWDEESGTLFVNAED
jgi:hypothetical protein